MLALATTSAAASPSMSCASRASQSPRASTNVTRGGLPGSAHCRKPERLVRRRADDDNTRSSPRSRLASQARFDQQQVARVGARQRGSDVCQRVGGERQVFPQVHGDVDGVGTQRDTEIAGEAAAPAQQLGHRRVELAVAGGREKGVLDLQAGMTARAMPSPTRRACTCASTLARAPITMGLSEVICCLSGASNPCATACSRAGVRESTATRALAVRGG